MSQVIRKYSKKETEKFRKNLLRNGFVPFLQKKFNKMREVNSAVLFVAQYWDDEANDAVHYHLAYSFSHSPDVQTYFKGLRALVLVDDDSDEAWDRRQRAEKFIDSDALGAKLDGAYKSELHRYSNVSAWHDNALAPYFAAYCSEQGHQNSEIYDAYLPYALFRRGNKGITIEVVGEMVRPWLDGVAGEWESR